MLTSFSFVPNALIHTEFSRNPSRLRAACNGPSQEKNRRRMRQCRNYWTCNGLYPLREFKPKSDASLVSFFIWQDESLFWPEDFNNAYRSHRSSPRQRLLPQFNHHITSALLAVHFSSDHGKHIPLNIYLFSAEVLIRSLANDNRSQLLQ